MSRRSPLAISAALAGAGALASIAISSTSSSSTELVHLGEFLAIGTAMTVALTVLVAPRLSRLALGPRIVSIGSLAVLVSLLNLAVLAWLMLIGHDELAAVAALIVYSAAAGIGAALATARASSDAMAQLSESARRLGGGDLDARTGKLDGGPELDALAGALDEMADQLSRSLERTRSAEEQRRDLIVAVSHDLRTPLSGVRAMVEAIDEGVVDDVETVQRYVHEMRSSVDSLVTLVDDLFELVQLDAGAIVSATEQARLSDVVASAIAACDAQASEKGLALELSLDGAGQVMVSPRLTRVVQNLLQNAIRHTPADGTVRVEARRAGEGVEVIVQDSGSGIDEASLERVFEPFWRGDAARVGFGSGLGLALAKRIVEAHGGTIAVESVPAQGSRFAVLLP